jgi:hypothetical protein
MRTSELNVNLIQNARATEVQKCVMHHCSFLLLDSCVVMVSGILNFRAE